MEPTTYLHGAGFKGTADTGREGAAKATRTLGRRQAACLAALEHLGEATADRVAKHLDLHWFHIRPRFSELKSRGLVVDTGRREDTGLGGKTVIFRPSTLEERALHAARGEAAARAAAGE